MTVLGDGRANLSGYYAGAVTRAIAYAADWAILVGVYAGSIAVAGFLWNLISRNDFDASRQSSWLWAVGFAVWYHLYFGYCWAMSGKTAGMTLLGLRVVRGDGSDCGPRRAVVRLVAFPLSFLLLGAGFLGIVLGARHRALHDVIADTAVVYDWDARAARLRFLSRHRAPV